MQGLSDDDWVLEGDRDGGGVWIWWWWVVVDGGRRFCWDFWCSLILIRFRFCVCALRLFCLALQVFSIAARVIYFHFSPRSSWKYNSFPLVLISLLLFFAQRRSFQLLGIVIYFHFRPHINETQHTPSSFILFNYFWLYWFVKLPISLNCLWEYCVILDNFRGSLKKLKPQSMVRWW